MIEYFIYAYKKVYKMDLSGSPQKLTRLNAFIMTDSISGTTLHEDVDSSSLFSEYIAEREHHLIAMKKWIRNFNPVDTKHAQPNQVLVGPDSSFGYEEIAHKYNMLCDEYQKLEEYNLECRAFLNFMSKKYRLEKEISKLHKNPT